MSKITENFWNNLRKDKKLLFIVLLGVCGMLLLLFSGSSHKTSESDNSERMSINELQKDTEKRLTALLETVDGAGAVKVMISFESAEEYIYAVNTEIESKADSYEHNDKFVIIEDKNGSQGLTLKVLTPAIKGVGITCEGASSAVVRQEIMKLASAALGVSVNKIWVTVMEE